MLWAMATLGFENYINTSRHTRMQTEWSIQILMVVLQVCLPIVQIENFIFFVLLQYLCFVQLILVQLQLFRM
jgi:hypothetical protein